MSKFKVIIAEKMDIRGIELLQKQFDVDVCIGISREELLKRIHDYDALLVRSATQVNEELLEKATKLRIVGRAGNGTDNIDIHAATKKGVIVANTPESNSISACELGIALMMACARDVAIADKDMKAGKWSRNSFEGVELYNKTLGIIGLGRIGSLMATRMKAFGMKIVAYDPYISDERFSRFGVKKAENLDELLRVSDFITIHTPRTEETIDMISFDEIEKMKDNVILVNVARGKIVNEDALYRGLKGGKIRGAGIDVHAVEPRYESPLYEFDNFIPTPHIGANTAEAQENVGIAIAQQVANGLHGEIVETAVNLPVMEREGLKDVKPYIELMENLGKIYYQLYTDSVKFVEINYWGDVSKLDTQMADLAFTKGLLQPILGNSVNYVNAKIMAENAGIGMKEKKFIEHFGNYSNLVTIKITNSKNYVFTISGTISSNAEGKLVELEGFDFEVKPTEYMLFIKNKDVPGVIGHVGTLAGEKGINIATMQVGRKTKGDTAIMILTIDEEVCGTTLEEFKKMDNIVTAKSVVL
ncbi:phosphoglycerate dehydrogenase [uncultured Ilyobacter sp.]|uniref:phosphoglycerate dehydrogenase n=1 Tax=uncultured Ilyobacter sp. TaxID=544433 RepID=UPI0029F5AD70|nr:phosphoglycerate dehydrogenase [uncultured Ilyobacter sp.]